MNWIALSLLAPLFWAFSNFVDKYSLGRYTKSIPDFLFFSSLTSWVFTLGLVIWHGLPEINYYSLIPVLTGMILIYSYGFYAKALQEGDTSSLVVLFELIPVTTAVMAFVFLGQVFSAKETIASAIVLLGAGVVSYERSEGGFSFMKGFRPILTAIILWSLLFLLIDYGMEHMTFWDFFTLDSFGSAIAGLTLFIPRATRSQVLSSLRAATFGKHIIFFCNNLLDFLGQMSIKRAIGLAPLVGLTTVLIQVQSFYSIVIGATLTLLLPNIIREDISQKTLAKKFLGAAVMFWGVYMLVV